MSAAIHATGPKTPQGKTVAARNAVTHGLHAQDAVLSHLGESQAEFDALCDGLTRELSPRTAVQEHYADPALTNDDRITKMARVLRHDAALRRHIDRALSALRDEPTNCQNEPPPCTGMARHAPIPPASEGLTVGATLRGCPPAPHYWGRGADWAGEPFPV